jgi:CRISPR type III-B/RAMP module-associated protein Cmr5
MPDTLEHCRARFASRVVNRRFGATRDASDKKLRSYRSTVLGAVPMLRESGLLQVFAFWYSKEDKRPVLEDVLEWLASAENRRTAALCAAQRDRSAVVAGNLDAGYRALLERNSRQLAVIEDEAEAVLGWLKRLVEGRVKSLEED